MITVSTNPQIKNIIKLMQKPKARRDKCAFVAEGIKMFLEVPPDMVKKVYLAEFLSEDMPGAVSEKVSLLREMGIGTEVVSSAVFKSVSDTVTPQGILYIAQQPAYELSDFLDKIAPLFLILEDLQDPGNLGTIMRTAECAGATAVIMNRGCVDLFNPKVIRSTMGSVFRVPFVYVDDIAEAVCRLKENGVNVFAAHLKGSDDYVNTSYIEGTAFLVGSEGSGLTEETAALADSFIKIPMQGQAESLNASMASGLLMYEAYRQRRQSR